MAKLVMSKEEKQKPLLEWDNESLGKMVKAASLVLYGKEDPKGMIGVGDLNITACGVTLIAEAIANGSDELSLVIEGASKKGVPLGNWRILVTQLEPKEKDVSGVDEVKMCKPCCIIRYEKARMKHGLAYKETSHLKRVGKDPDWSENYKAYVFECPDCGHSHELTYDRCIL